MRGNRVYKKIIKFLNQYHVNFEVHHFFCILKRVKFLGKLCLTISQINYNSIINNLKVSHTCFIFHLPK